MLQVKRTRSAKALANDKLIRLAGVAEVLRVGVDHISLRDVGERAGFTHGATYARYEDVNELLVDLWNSLLRERVVGMIELCNAAAEHRGSESTRALIDFIGQTTPADIAGLHLLLSARRIPTLLEEVEPFIDEHLRCEESDGPTADARFVRSMAVFSMLVARVMSEFHFTAFPGDLAVLERILRDTLSVEPSAADAIILEETGVRFVPVPEDDQKSQLGYATFVVVGKSGYTHATISRIARRANCSPGVIYKMYPSKEDLMVAAFDASLNPKWLQVDNFVKVLDAGYLAQSLYDMTSDANAIRRDFVLESALAAAYNPRIHESMKAPGRSLVTVTPLLGGVTEEERNALVVVVRTFAFLVTGVSMLSAAVGGLHRANLSQFTEPFRRAVLEQCGPSWDDYCKLLVELTSP
jgi:AcrR family transcriptional regulator